MNFSDDPTPIIRLLTKCNRIEQNVDFFSRLIAQLFNEVLGSSSDPSRFGECALEGLNQM
ncbi:hypothetical protein Leryth_010243 [Lithospermum erythrorhizon]|nr:hypothetical protein Leryth_010243 [Lithospermum erythrorhizon]